MFVCMAAVSTTIIHPKASVHPSVELGPFCYIEEGVSIGPGCRLASHVVIRKGTHLESDVQVDSFAVLGGLPQDLSFEKGLNSFVYIGARTCIREGVTIHRSTVENGATRIGKDCYLMAQSHVGHDCILKNQVILVNNALLAGHVRVDDKVTVGGNTSIHQFIRVGEGAMLGGFSGFTKDIPPFCLVAERNRLAGLNLVGLKRSGVEDQALKELKDCYSLVFSKTGASLVEKAQMLLSSGHYTTREAHIFLSFFQASKKGILSPRPL